MGLSGKSDKNGQTTNKDSDHSKLTLNTLTLCFPRQVKGGWGGVLGNRGEGGRVSSRQADRKRVGERHEREMRR